MLLDYESLYALILFRSLPPEYQDRATLLLEELQRKTAQTPAHSSKEGETE